MTTGYDGTSIEVTWGENLFAPIQYNSFRVGPFRMTVTVRADESVADAVARGQKELALAARRVFPQLLKEHFDMTHGAVNEARAR
jgi:hypothetical protein